MNEVVHPFPPVVGPESRTLILGSFPSVRSREEGFFYGHPRNRFWPMLAAIYHEHQEDKKIHSLIRTASELSSPMKDIIVRTLQESCP